MGFRKNGSPFQLFQAGSTDSFELISMRKEGAGRHLQLPKQQETQGEFFVEKKMENMVPMSEKIRKFVG